MIGRGKSYKTPTGTLKCDAKWKRVFEDYLRGKDFANTEYWTYPDDELDSILSKFCFEMRSSQVDDKGDFIPYSITSLHSLRNGLTREIVRHSRNITINILCLRSLKFPLKMHAKS